MKVIIVHGAYGNPSENWIPWLKRELEGMGCEVFVPAFPTPDGQSLENWMEAFRQYEEHFGDDLLLVGHSIGVAFLLSVLEKPVARARAAFLVAGFLCSLENPSFDELNRTFIEKPFFWDVIRENCSSFYVFNSDDDPYVSLDKGDDVAKNLGVDVTLVEGAGHFNSAADYDRFELLLEKMKEVM